MKDFGRILPKYNIVFTWVYALAEKPDIVYKSALQEEMRFLHFWLYVRTMNRRMQHVYKLTKGFRP